MAPCFSLRFFLLPLSPLSQEGRVSLVDKSAEDVSQKLVRFFTSMKILYFPTFSKLCDRNPRKKINFGSRWVSVFESVRQSKLRGGPLTSSVDAHHFLAWCTPLSLSLARFALTYEGQLLPPPPKKSSEMSRQIWKKSNFAVLLTRAPLGGGGYFEPPPLWFSCDIF